MNWKKNVFIGLFLFGAISFTLAQKAFDLTLEPSQGDLKVHVLGHASVMFEWNNQTIYVDPYSSAYNFDGMRLADLILITHEHSDHFDSSAINKIKKESTIMVYTNTCYLAQPFAGSDTIMSNGDSINILNLPIEAVAAYNILTPRHVKGVGNGYIITFGNKHVYLAGDTEIIPEMSEIKNIYLAFLGYSKYNLTASMFTEVINLLNLTLVIPYHYDSNNITSLINSVKSETGLTLLTENPGTSSNATDLQLSGEAVFYPNPTHNTLFCDKLKSSSIITIYDTTGKLVKSCSLKSPGSIDVRLLPVGLYSVSVENGDESFGGKFFKKQ